MFCHECGSQLSEEAVFCHKCGTKVHNEEANQYKSSASEFEHKGAMKKLDAILVETGPNKVKVIKVISERRQLGLKESKELADNIPSLLEKGVSEKEAEIIKALFAHEGAKVSFTDQEGNVVNVQIHCEKCGEVVDEAKGICSSCGEVFEGTPASQISRAREGYFAVPRDDMDRKKVIDEFKEKSIAKLKKEWEKFGALSDIWKALITIGAVLIIGLIALIFIVILRLIFSSIITFLIAIAGCYIAYQRWGADYVIDFIYETKSNKLQLPEGMNFQTVLEALSGKFNYPYFEGVRYGKEGECIIKGKYSEYAVLFDANNVAYLVYRWGYKQKFHRIVLLETIAVRSYINKFFNPAMDVDTIKDFNALKSAEKQQKMESIVFIVAALLVCLTIGIELFFPGGLQNIANPGMEVREAYLTQYSEEVMIEDAFESFFDNGKWSTYKDKEYSYVVFTGSCEYLGERADVKVRFKLTGENFIVDSLDLNGQEQNDLILYGLLTAVYEGY